MVTTENTQKERLPNRKWLQKHQKKWIYALSVRIVEKCIQGVILGLENLK